MRIHPPESYDWVSNFLNIGYFRLSTFIVLENLWVNTNSHYIEIN